MKCESCDVPLGVAIKDGRGFLPVYIDTWIGGGAGVARSGPYCPMCQKNKLAGLSLWADGMWRPKGAEKQIKSGNNVPGVAFP